MMYDHILHWATTSNAIEEELTMLVSAEPVLLALEANIEIVSVWNV